MKPAIDTAVIRAQVFEAYLKDLIAATTDPSHRDYVAAALRSCTDALVYLQEVQAMAASEALDEREESP